MPRHAFRHVLASATLALAGTLASAQDAYPSKPIRIVVPYPAGGSADAVARVFSQRLAEQLKANVIVENKSGASGTLGAESVVRAEPDGHTLLLTVTTQLSNSAVGVKPNYNALEDFAPIVGITLAPMALAVPVSVPAQDMKQFERLARTAPLAYGSYGVGTSGHVMLSLFNRSIGGNMVHVPYRGEMPMVTDMLGGQVQAALLTVGIAREMQDSGKMRLLATVGPERSEILPKLPTFTELGYGGFDWTYGVALYASSKVSPPVLRKLEQTARAIMASPETQAKLRAIGAQPWGAPAPELKKRLAIDTVRWNRTLEQFGKIE